MDRIRTWLRPWLVLLNVVALGITLLLWAVVLGKLVLPSGQTYAGMNGNQTQYVSCPSALFFDKQSFADSLIGSSSVGTDYGDRNSQSFANAVADDCQRKITAQTAGVTTLMLVSIPTGLLWLRVVLERKWWSLRDGRSTQ